MKKFTAPQGYEYLLDDEPCKGLATPDDFDESRLTLITEAEAEEIRKRKDEEQKNSIDQPLE